MYESSLVGLRQSPRPTTTGGLCGGAGGASCLESSTVWFDGSPRGKSRTSASAQRGSSARLASAVTKRFCRDDADAAVMAIDEAVADADWRQWLKVDSLTLLTPSQLLGPIRQLLFTAVCNAQTFVFPSFV
eukprot:4238734-Pleurochrysis_carterae.AAC.1